LGKAGVTLTAVYLHKSSPWVELSDAYFAQFNVVIRKIANLSDVVPHLRGVHTLFVDTRLSVGNSDTTALSRSDVKRIVATLGFNSKPPTGFAGLEVPFSYVDLGGVTNFSGRIRFFVRVRSNARWIGEYEASVRSVARDLRFVLKSGRSGVKRPKPKPIPRTAVT
jgi:hypothetical protein